MSSPCIKPIIRIAWNLLHMRRIFTRTFSRLWHVPLKLACSLPINTEINTEVNKYKRRHTLVPLMTSNCCTWLEPRSVDYRHITKHFADMFCCFRGRQHYLNLEYMFCKHSDRSEEVPKVQHNKSN